MALFEWNSSYSVGVPDMDDQHKKLFAMINQLHEAMSKRQGDAVLGKLFDGLADYTRTHFSAEEAFLSKINHPDLAIQKAAHQTFVKKLMEMKAKSANSQVGLTLDAMVFLKDWLKNHIMGIDKKYSPVHA